MKKVCVTSVVSLLLVFLLVFAGCEQPVSAGLKDDGSVTVEGNAVTGQDNTSGEVTSGEGSTTVVEGETGDGNAVTGEDNTSGEVTSGEDSTTVVEGETGDGNAVTGQDNTSGEVTSGEGSTTAVEGETGDGTTETGSGVVSVEVDTGDDDVIVSVVVVEPDDPSVESVVVDPALELRIVDLDGREGPFTVDYDDNPRITLKAVVKGGDGPTITDAVWKTDGTTAYSLQNNEDGTCTLTAQRRGSTFSAYDGVFTLSVSSGNDSGSCTIHYNADPTATDGFID